MSTMTQKMEESSGKVETKGGAATKGLPAPKKGNRYTCGKCGMAIEVTTGCSCSGNEHVRFECCGQALTKA